MTYLEIAIQSDKYMSFKSQLTPDKIVSRYCPSTFIKDAPSIVLPGCIIPTKCSLCWNTESKVGENNAR